jgi:hypothetical protein
MAKREMQRREKETEDREKRRAERQEKDAQSLQRMKNMLTLPAIPPAAQSNTSTEHPAQQPGVTCSEPIRKTKPVQPVQDRDEVPSDDDSSNGADNGAAGDTADSASDTDTSATPTHLIPLIESWLIHANLERLSTALANDFRAHPDNPGDYSFGSTNDRILSVRPKTVTDAIMRKWQKTNPWIYNKDILHGFLDPTQWPGEWSYIPRTYLHQFFRKCNTGPTTNTGPTLPSGSPTT